MRGKQQGRANANGLPVLQLADPLYGSSLSPADPRALRARQTLARSALRAGLSQLPAPQNEYQIEAPELPDDEEDEAMGDGAGLEEDAADAKARKRREAEAARAAEEARKSAALRRGLPRPADLDGLPAARGDGEIGKLSLRERAEELVARELARLLAHDAAKYPPGRDGKKGAKRDRNGSAGAAAPPLERFEDSELAAAAALVRSEAAFLRHAYGHGATPDGEYFDAWNAAARDVLILPGNSRQVGRTSAASPAERVEALRGEWEAARGVMTAEARRAAKLEQKATLLLAGLQNRDAAVRQRADALWSEVADAAVELECFGALHAQEQRAAPQRIEAAAAALAAARQREADLQERYKLLRRQRDELAGQLAAAVQ